MRLRGKLALAAAFAAFLAPTMLACDDGMLDRQEGAAEEVGEEIDDAVDEARREIDRNS